VKGGKGEGGKEGEKCGNQSPAAPVRNKSREEREVISAYLTLSEERERKGNTVRSPQGKGEKRVLWREGGGGTTKREKGTAAASSNLAEGERAGSIIKGEGKGVGKKKGKKKKRQPGPEKKKKMGSCHGKEKKTPKKKKKKKENRGRRWSRREAGFSPCGGGKN